MNSLSAVFRPKDVHYEQCTKQIKQWLPAYNIRPLQKLPLLTGGVEINCQITTWGYQENGRDYISAYANARSVHSSNSFRLPFRQNRCIAMIDSYYAWDESRVPRRYHSDKQKVLFAAALFVPQFQSFVLLYKYETGTQNKLPVLLNKKEQKAWLGNFSTVPELVDIVQKNKLPKLNAHLVSNKIFVHSYNGAELHEYTPYHYDLFKAV